MVDHHERYRQRPQAVQLWKVRLSRPTRYAPRTLVMSRAHPDSSPRERLDGAQQNSRVLLVEVPKSLGQASANLWLLSRGGPSNPQARVAKPAGAPIAPIQAPSLLGT